jgi:acyl-CoA synthetase (AMP-forming)/AMP-acid ligase II
MADGTLYILQQALSGRGADTVGLAAVNSIDFVRHSFSLYAEGNAAATFRSESDRTRFAKLGVKRFVTPRDDKGWARLTFAPSDSDLLAQIIFTSGTTGEPKAICLTQGNIANTTRRLNAVMKIDSGIREYIGVPVTYSFGLARARAVASAGGEFYIPQNGFSPFEIAQMLQRGEINAISAVPTLWRLLLQNSDLFGPERNAVKWLEIGSQLMTREEKKALRELFPNAIIVQHYGLTEASRATFLRVDEANDDALQSVGEAIAPTEVKTDLAGRIMIRGPHVARFELSIDGLIALTDAEGWLTTNDVGSIRDGYLYFDGRLDDIINCGGVKINPDTLEREFADALGATIDEIAVARLPDPMRGDGILVALRGNSRLDDNAVRIAAISATATLGVNAAGAIKVCRLDSFARTETGKLKRGAVVDQYLALANNEEANTNADNTVIDAQHVAQRPEDFGGRAILPQDSLFDLGGDLRAGEALNSKMQAASIPSGIARGLLDDPSIHEIDPGTLAQSGAKASNDLEQEILSVWREALGRADVSVDDSFYDIGGDSLSAVTVALNLERAGFEPVLAHGVFDGKTIRELARDHSAGGVESAADSEIAPARKTEVAVFSEASNFMKGIVLLCMIASHWLPPYLRKVGLDKGPVADFLALFFSLGTPTLAFMFGMGVAVFHARQYQNSRSSFDRNIQIALALLLIGVVLNGALEIAVQVSAGGSLDGWHWVDKFYGPFIYFLVATASLPFWIGRLGKGVGSLIALSAASIAFYGVYAQLTVMLPAQPEGQETILNELAVGRWSLLQMSAVSLFGAGIGILIQARLNSGARLGSFAGFGVVMIAGALVASAAFGRAGIWFEFPKQISLFTMFFYAGIALVVISVFRPLTGLVRGNLALRSAVDITSCIGILLFPLFVLQTFVFRSATIWYRLTGDHFLTALTLLIVLFMAAAAVLARKVYKIYYAGRQ